MQTNTRICRAQVEAQIGRPEMTRRQKQREERVLAAGQLLMAQHGRHGITFRMLAGALRIATGTLAWHYADLDALLGEILRTYLQTLHTILGEVPFDHPNRQPALRAAYLKAIQGPFGGLTPLHTLLTRDRHLLPEDELATIEPTLQGLAELLAGDLGPIALDLLERPWINPAQAEALLITIAAPAQPHPEPAPAPKPIAALPEVAPPARLPDPPPTPRPFFHFDIQDIPLPIPGSLAAMTDKELEEADRLNPPAPPMVVSPQPLAAFAAR